MTTETKAKRVKAALPAVPPPNLQGIRFLLTGTTPLVQRPTVVRHRKDCVFYQVKDGWRGIPVYGIQTSLFNACRFHKGIKGTSAKLGIQVIPEGIDTLEGTPLARITKGEPSCASVVDEKLEGGVFYPKGWEAEVLISFDGDLFKPREIVELFKVAGEEIGLGRLRPDRKSAKSKPCYDYGVFSVKVL